MNDQHGRYTRLRYTATGALAALFAAGAIAGASVLAATPRIKSSGHSTVQSSSPTKMPVAPVPAKTHASQPGSSQPFLTSVQRLVADGTISAAEGQAVDREILAGTVDTQTLASSGLTQTQLQAVQAALANTKRALGPGGARGPK